MDFNTNAVRAQVNDKALLRVFRLILSSMNYLISVYLLWLCIRNTVFLLLLVISRESRDNLSQQLIFTVLYCTLGIMLPVWVRFCVKRQNTGLPYIWIPSLLVISILIAGYAPYSKAVTNSFNIYRSLGDGTYSYKPGYIYKEDRFNSVAHINRAGRRTCPWSVAGKGDSIVLVGDSFTFGLHLNEKDTLCAALGDTLSKRRPDPFSIHNLGFPGTNFSSYIRTADLYVKSVRPDWLFIEYLPGNDLIPFDSFDEIRLLQHSWYYKFITVLLGSESAARTHRLYYNITEKTDGEPLAATDYSREILTLRTLVKKHRVVIYSYYGKAAFVDLIQRNVPGLKTLVLELPKEARGHDNAKYIIPNDGHPTGRANRMFAESIADFIVAQEKK